MAFGAVLGHRRRRPDELGRRERALQDAADSLGVALGEYYPDETELSEPSDEAGNTEFARRIAASREELLVYIDALRANKRRRRRRRLGLAVTCGTVAGALVGAIQAGVVGRWPASDDGRSAAGEPSATLRHLRSGAGIPKHGLEVFTELQAGHRKAVASTYVDIRNNICSSLAFVEGGVTGQRSVGGCLEPKVVRWALARQGAFFAQSVGQEREVLVAGLARPDLARLVPRRPRRGVAIAVSGIWNVGGKDRGDLAAKMFLLRIPHGRSLDPIDAPAQALDGRTIRIEAIFRGGRTRPVKGP